MNNQMDSRNSAKELLVHCLSIAILLSIITFFSTIGLSDTKVGDENNAILFAILVIGPIEIVM